MKPAELGAPDLQHGSFNGGSVRPSTAICAGQRAVRSASGVVNRTVGRRIPHDDDTMLLHVMNALHRLRCVIVRLPNKGYRVRRLSMRVVTATDRLGSREAAVHDRNGGHNDKENRSPRPAQNSTSYPLVVLMHNSVAFTPPNQPPVDRHSHHERDCESCGHTEPKQWAAQTGVHCAGDQQHYGIVNNLHHSN